MNSDKLLKIETTLVGGLLTACLTREELAEKMVADCYLARSNDIKPKVVFSSNGQGISLAAKSPLFLKAMNEANLIHADGQSVVFASQIFSSKPLPERIATTDFFHDAAIKAQEHGLTFFMLGASEEENLEACVKILEQYPRLKIVGRKNGYLSEKEKEELVNEINDLKPDVLWVALGKPKQEFWCIEMKERLNVGWIKTCGGLYSFLSGRSPRAPIWMQKIGLEWLYRAFKSPKRLAWRYLTTNPHALLLLLLRSK